MQPINTRRVEERLGRQVETNQIKRLLEGPFPVPPGLRDRLSAELVRRQAPRPERRLSAPEGIPIQGPPSRLEYEPPRPAPGTRAHMSQYAPPSIVEGLVWFDQNVKDPERRETFKRLLYARTNDGKKSLTEEMAKRTAQDAAVESVAQLEILNHAFYRDMPRAATEKEQAEWRERHKRLGEWAPWDAPWYDRTWDGHMPSDTGHGAHMVRHKDKEIAYLKEKFKPIAEHLAPISSHIITAQLPIFGSIFTDEQKEAVADFNTSLVVETIMAPVSLIAEFFGMLDGTRSVKDRVSGLAQVALELSKFGFAGDLADLSRGLFRGTGKAAFLDDLNKLNADGKISDETLDKVTRVMEDMSEDQVKMVVQASNKSLEEAARFLENARPKGVVTPEGKTVTEALRDGDEVIVEGIGILKREGDRVVARTLGGDVVEPDGTTRAATKPDSPSPEASPKPDVPAPPGRSKIMGLSEDAVQRTDAPEAPEVQKPADQIKTVEEVEELTTPAYRKRFQEWDEANKKRIEELEIRIASDTGFGAGLPISPELIELYARRVSGFVLNQSMNVDDAVRAMVRYYKDQRKIDIELDEETEAIIKEKADYIVKNSKLDYGKTINPGSRIETGTESSFTVDLQVLAAHHGLTLPPNFSQSKVQTLEEEFARLEQAGESLNMTDAFGRVFNRMSNVDLMVNREWVNHYTSEIDRITLEMPNLKGRELDDARMQVSGLLTSREQLISSMQLEASARGRDLQMLNDFDKAIKQLSPEQFARMVEARYRSQGAPVSEATSEGIRSTLREANRLQRAAEGMSGSAGDRHPLEKIADDVIAAAQSGMDPGAVLAANKETIDAYIRAATPLGTTTADVKSRMVKIASGLSDLQAEVDALRASIKDVRAGERRIKGKMDRLEGLKRKHAVLRDRLSQLEVLEREYEKVKADRSSTLAAIRVQKSRKYGERIDATLQELEQLEQDTLELLGKEFEYKDIKQRLSDVRAYYRTLRAKNHALRTEAAQKSINQLEPELRKLEDDYGMYEGAKAQLSQMRADARKIREKTKRLIDRLNGQSKAIQEAQRIEEDRLADILKELKKPSLLDEILMFRKANLLSTPITIGRNFLGNLIQMTQTVALQPVEEVILRAMQGMYRFEKDTPKATFKRGILWSPAQVARAFQKATKRGPDSTWAEMKRIWTRGPRLDEIKKYDVYVESRFILTRQLLRLQAMQDVPFRNFVYHMSIERQARAFVDSGEFDGSIRELVDNPTEHMKFTARYEADYAVFASDNKIAKLIRGIGEVGPGEKRSETTSTFLAKILRDMTVPFVRATSNIGADIATSNPVGIGYNVLSRWNALKFNHRGILAKEPELWDSYALSEKEARHLARAYSKGLLGSGLLLAGMKAAQSGSIFLPFIGEVQVEVNPSYAPTDREAREMAYALDEPPLSLRVNGVVHNLGGTHPIMNLIGLGATAWYMFQRNLFNADIQSRQAELEYIERAKASGIRTDVMADVHPKDWQSRANSLSAGVTAGLASGTFVAMEQPFYTGIKQLTDDISRGRLDSMFYDQVATLWPGASLVRQVRGLSGEETMYKRYDTSFLQEDSALASTIAQRMGVQYGSAFRRVDALGKETPGPKGLNAINPLSSRRQRRTDAIDLLKTLPFVKAGVYDPDSKAYAPPERQVAAQLAGIAFEDLVLHKKEEFEYFRDIYEDESQPKLLRVEAGRVIVEGVSRLSAIASRATGEFLKGELGETPMEEDEIARYIEKNYAEVSKAAIRATKSRTTIDGIPTGDSIRRSITDGMEPDLPFNTSGGFELRDLVGDDVRNEIPRP